VRALLFGPNQECGLKVVSLNMGSRILKGVLLRAESFQPPSEAELAIEACISFCDLEVCVGKYIFPPFKTGN